MADATGTSLADAGLLEKIDKLFACGVGDHISLPQIVVVGDQSSGKSSVLEGLVRMEFPRDSGLCTRFATQIVFRRSEAEKIAVSIIPDSKCSPEKRAELESWGYKNLSTLDNARFLDIMKEVHVKLDLAPTGRLNTGKPTFSDSVLRLEFSGPHQEHLSVIDVPGIFKNSRAGLTTKQDITFVRSMVEHYMKNPRTVMLVVVPANVDPATQEILDMAAEADREGDRTLGVLTKPDLVDKGAEREVLRMLEGESYDMRFGWHVVRNAGQSELGNPVIDRAQLEEKFFNDRAPWNSLHNSKVGVEALRVRLTQILSELVVTSFQKVKEEVLKTLARKELVLAALGPDRSSSHAQSAYLTSLAVKFQDIVPKNFAGKFASTANVDSTSVPSLVKLLSGRMEEFSHDLGTHGHTYCFKRSASHSNDNSGSGTDNSDLAIDQEDNEQAEDGACEDLQLFERSVDSVNSRRYKAVGQLCEVLPHLHDLQIAKDDIMPWLTKIHEETRGFTLGTFEPSILASIMKHQSANWPSISLGFVSDVIVLIHKTITAALEYVCPDKTLRSNLMTALMPALILKYKEALAHATFLLKVECNGLPMTLNHYFNENLQKARQNRLAQQLEQRVECVNGIEYVRRDEVMKTHPMSNSDYTVQDIHDILLSYYKVARKRFTDNIAQQAMAAYLLFGEDSPLMLFSPVFVANLTDEKRFQIAGEARSVQQRRTRLTKEVVSLAEASTILAAS